jgi:hypothetical protein
MDLICLILLIIDLFKPSMPLSITTIIVSLLELFLLLYNKMNFGFAYMCALAGIFVGVFKICIL